MEWKVKVHSKVSKRLFTGAIWKLEGRTYEVLSSNEDDGMITVEDDLGNQSVRHANDFVKGEFQGDKYDGIEDVDEE